MQMIAHGHDKMPDVWTTVVNLREPTNRWRVGTKAYVIQISGDGITCKLLIRSRSGRWIRDWVRIDRVRDPRVVWVPPRFRTQVISCEKREWAQESADRLAAILKGKIDERTDC